MINDSYLKVVGLSVRYGGVKAVDEISFSIGESEIATIIGANGAGKSSTLMAISGLAPTTGEIWFDGENISGLSAVERVRKGIVQVPEGRRIFGRLTVLENLKIGAFSQKDQNNLDAEIDKVCELFPILHERCDQRGGTLSGGEQQMLAIARGLLARPRLLLLDEPSLGLSPIYAQRIFSVIKHLASEGRTILLVEQNARAALKISKTAYCLESGRITLQGDSKDLANDERVQAAYLGG